MASSKSPLPEPKEPELRMVLVGKTGTGKSASGNTILGIKWFTSKICAIGVTARCQKGTRVFGGKILDVVDTPGLFDPQKSNELLVEKIAECISLAAPGPHAFLVVIQPNRFTKEEQETVKIIQETFGEEAARHTMVLFTHGDALKEDGVSIEEIIGQNEDLDKFVHQCHGGHQVFDNKVPDESQVHELLGKINGMVQKNGGRFYTNEKFQAGQKAKREEERRLLKENPHMDPEEARRRAEMDNTFIRECLRAAAVAASRSVGGFVGDRMGAAVVGAAEAIKTKACIIQ